MEGRFNDSEIVIGLVGAVGTNLDEIVDIISERLKRYKYTTQKISVSSDILSRFLSVPSQATQEFDRITTYMGIGNDIREKADSKAIALGVADTIRSSVAVSIGPSIIRLQTNMKINLLAVISKLERTQIRVANTK